MIRGKEKDLTIVTDAAHLAFGTRIIAHVTLLLSTQECWYPC